MPDVEALEMNVSFEGMPPEFFLVGLINEFNNRFQTAGDTFFKELSWKQCFLLNCITFFKEPPNIGQLAELVGCSHQNTKQMLLKLENGGYVRLFQDETDKRKRRVAVTERTNLLREKYNEGSLKFMQALFGEVSAQEIAATTATITKLDARLKEIMGESK